MNKRYPRCLSIFLAVAMVFQLVISTPWTVAADGAGESTPGVVLAFSSDVHNKSNNQAAVRLGTWIDNIVNLYGDIEVIGFCGDLGDASNSRITADQYWSYAQEVMETVDSKGVPAVYTTGNHEYDPGKIGSTSNSTTARYIVDQEAVVGDNYLIYCMGAAGSSQADTGYSSSQIDALAAYLNNAGNGKPIFILTHFPLHYFSSRTTKNASDVIDALNAAVENNGQKIILIWGHNHTERDTHYDQIFEPGASLEYKSGSTKDIRFYYAGAGCMCDSEYYNGGSASVLGKGLVVTIDDRNLLTFSYRDATGGDVTEGGPYSEPEPVEPVDVTGVTIDQAEEDVNVEVGKTVTLTASVEPEDATDRTVTWSSSDTEVATVDANGKVKGVGEGSATITATAGSDSVGGPFTADIDIEVTARSTERQYYVIMANGYAMSRHASSEMMSNTSGYEYHGLEAVPYSAGDPAPYDILWTIEPADGATDSFYIRSYNGELLSASYERNSSSSGYTGLLVLGDTEDTWVIDGGLETWESDGGKLKGVNASNNGRSQDMFLAVTTSNNSVGFFTVRSSNNAQASTLVEPAEILEPVAVTGVTVEPETLSLEAGKSAQLTATIEPADADDQVVTWTSDNEEVATVDANGRVRAVSAGAAVITVTTDDGGKTDTCAVTVTPKTTPSTGYVITIGDYALSANASSDVYVNNTNYRYAGLAGVAYDPNEEPDDEILWLITETEGGYYIQSQDGQYLNATYIATTNPSGCDAQLKLDDTPDVWVLEGSLEDWVLEGSTLKSTNADKSLTHEEGSTAAPLNLFTIRPTGESSSLSDPGNPAEVRYIETTSLSDGRDYIIGVMKGNSDAYVLRAPSGSSAGNTDTTTLAVVPASGSEKAYIVTDESRVVWRYTSSNKYLTNNSRYLYRAGSSSNYVPGVSTSSSSRGPVTYSSTNKRFSLKSSSSSSTSYYLTNSSGTFKLSSSSSSAAQVRLYEKTTVFNFRYVVQFIDGNGHVVYATKLEKNAVPTYTGATPIKDEDAEHTYTFTGWKCGNTTYGPQDTLPAVTGAMTFTAQFEAVPKAHTVTFETNGAGAIDPQTVPHGQKATEPDAPEKNACSTFAGWYSDEECETAYDFDTPVEADIELYAKWTTHHDLTAHAAKEETCTEAGNSAYWSCSVCGKYFGDEAGENEIEENSWVIAAGGHAMDKTEAKAETCTEAGNSEYWSCSKCHKYFSDEAGENEIEENSWVIPADGHAMDKTDAKAESCTEAGNSEYWRCSKCHKYFSDEAGENEIAENSWIIPASGHAMDKTDAKAETCTEAGNSEYYSCGKCHKYFSDEAGVHEIAENSWVIAASGHAMEKTEAKTTTCAEAGNSEYYSCSKCHKYFSDEAGGNEIEENSWIIPALPHSLEKTDAKAATCTAAGNSAYWTCTVCHKYFGDEEGTTEVEEDSWILPMIDHTLEKTDAKVATCTEAGNSAYWICSACGKYFSDEAGENEIAKDSWIIPADGHAMDKTDAKAETCTEAGNSEYWSCSKCNKYFSDEAGEHEIAENSWVIPADGHAMDKTDAKAETCTEAGNSEYYTCSKCHKYFSDEAGEHEIAENSWIIPASGHAMSKTEAKAETCTEAGNSEYYSCGKCHKYFSDEAGEHEIAENSWVIAASGHAMSKTDANAETCTEAGNSEYYTCSKCHKYFSDEAGEHEIAEDSWIIPASGHAMDKTDAKAETCTEAGNSEYYTCSKCHKYFSDEAGEHEIAENSWIIPASGHAMDKTDAKAETCTEGGNSEYYSCDKCHKYFSDEAGEHEIAENSWVIAASGHAMDKTDANAETCTEAGNSEYYTCSKCHKYFSDEAGEHEIAKDSWIIPASGHAMDKTDAKAETCTEAGNSEYYSCDKCHKYFSDEAGEHEIAEDSWIIPASGHAMDKTEAKAETCTEAGNSEYYTCNKCHKYFSDEASEHEIAKDSWIIPAKGHSYDAGVVTKKASFTEAGVITYTCQNDNDHTKTEAIAMLTVTGVTDKTYNGNAQTQSLTVKSGSKTLKSGTDYTVAYKNNVAAGTATVTVTAKGSQYTGSKSLNFKINPAVVEGTYYLYSSVGNKCLDVKGGKSARGTNIQIYTPNKTKAQQFKIQKYGKYYRIINVGSGKAVDVSGGKKTNGTNVQQWDWNKTNAQLWEFVPAGGNTFYIRNVGSGKMLDVKGAKNANGTNVQIYTSNKTNAQKWTLKSVTGN